MKILLHHFPDIASPTVQHRAARIERHSNTTLRQSRLTGNDRLAARLLGRVDHVAKYAASLIDLLEIDLLDEIEAKFVTHDLACDKDDRCAISISFEYSVDEVQAAGATASGRGRQVTRRQRFCLRSKCAGFLVAHRDPLDAASRERASDMIESITRDAVTLLDARPLQSLDDDVRNLFAHSTYFLLRFLLAVWGLTQDKALMWRTPCVLGCANEIAFPVLSYFTVQAPA
jgi:hypothetical protein